MLKDKPLVRDVCEAESSNIARNAKLLCNLVKERVSRIRARGNIT